MVALAETTNKPVHDAATLVVHAELGNQTFGIIGCGSRETVFPIV
jgi:hypothetical protein